MSNPNNDYCAECGGLGYTQSIDGDIQGGTCRDKAMSESKTEPLKEEYEVGNE